MKPPKKAHLVIQTAFLGDCIITFPLVERIHKLFPKDELLFFCREGLGSFIKDCFPFVTPIEVKKYCSKDYKIKRKHITENYELENVFCVHKSFRSMLFSKLLKAKNKIHYTNSYRKFLVSGVESNENLPEPLRVLSQLSPIDSKTKDQIALWYKSVKSPKSPQTVVPTEFKTNLKADKKKKFDIPEEYVILAPGSVWETKKWPAKKFGELANLIKMQLNIPVVILGSKQELELSRELKQVAPSVIDLTGETSLIECKNIIAHSKGFVGNDSGLVHMAALYNIPSVVVLGPTHESLGFVPWQNNVEVATLNLECSPCGTHGADKCPIKTHACMTDLGAQLVMSHLKKVLKSVPQKEVPPVERIHFNSL
jgi:heptosyltransferase-2